MDSVGKPLWEVLLEVDNIRKALLECNKKHFHQAAATPFGGEVGEGILADLVGYSGLTAVAKAIVEVTFMEQYGDSVDMLPEMTHLIMELVMPEDIQQLGRINPEVSSKDFYHWKESTSMSPLGWHLRHYKAIINDPERKKQAQDENYVSKHQLDFLEIYTKMVNIPLKYGFAPEQWCTSITVMIEKDPESPHIKCLQIIHLFEADYNFCLKNLWGSHMVHQGKDSGIPNAFVQTVIDDKNHIKGQQIIMKIWGPLVNMLVDIEPKVYEARLCGVWRKRQGPICQDAQSHLWHATVITTL